MLDMRGASEVLLSVRVQSPDVPCLRSSAASPLQETRVHILQGTTALRVIHQVRGHTMVALHSRHDPVQGS